MKQQLNEIKRMQQLAGIATKPLLNESKVVPTNYQFTSNQFDLLKKYGTKQSTNGQELFIPLTIKIELDKNKVDSKFKQEFYDTVPPSDGYLASQTLTNLKKALERVPASKINNQQYFVLKGTLTKNGNFNFESPYRKKQQPDK